MMYCRRMPPDFWAAAGLLTSPKIATPTAAPKMPRFAVIARFLPAGARGIGPVLPACGTIARRWRRVPGGRAAGPIICPFGDRLRRFSPVDIRPGEGLLTEPTAVVQPRLSTGPELPHSGH